MMEQQILDFLTTWLPVFVILSIIIFGLIKYAAIRSNYKVKEMNVVKKEKKDGETFSGAIGQLIDSAPKQLQQIDSEIATIKDRAIREHLTPEQTKSILSRLESERDALKLAARYGGLIKPIAKPLGAIFEKVIGGIGQ